MATSALNVFNLDQNSGVNLNVYLGGYNKAWSSSLSTTPVNDRNGKPLKARTNLLNGVSICIPSVNASANQKIDFYNYTSGFHLNNALQHKYRALDPTVGLSQNNVLFPLGINTFEDIFSLTTNQIIRAGLFNRPVHYEMWFGLNDFGFTNSLGYNNYTLFGSNDTGVSPTLEHTLPTVKIPTAGRIRSYVAGIFKIDANLSNPATSDIIAGARYVENNSVGTLELIIKGAVIDSLQVDKICEIYGNLDTKLKGEIASLDGATANVNQMSIWVKTTPDSVDPNNILNLEFTTTDEILPNTSIMDKRGLIDTYLVKQGFYIDADTGSSPGVIYTEDTIWYRPAPMYTVPRVPLDPPPCYKYPVYTPTAQISVFYADLTATDLYKKEGATGDYTDYAINLTSLVVGDLYVIELYGYFEQGETNHDYTILHGQHIPTDETYVLTNSCLIDDMRNIEISRSRGTNTLCLYLRVTHYGIANNVATDTACISTLPSCDDFDPKILNWNLIPTNSSGSNYPDPQIYNTSVPTGVNFNVFLSGNNGTLVNAYINFLECTNDSNFDYSTSPIVVAGAYQKDSEANFWRLDAVYEVTALKDKFIKVAPTYIPGSTKNVFDMGHTVFPDVFSQHRPYILLNSTTGKPFLMEHWYSANQYCKDNLVGFNGFTFLGDSFNESLPTVETTGIIRKYVAGIFKLNANLANILTSDIVAGVNYNQGELAIVLNGVVVASKSIGSTGALYGQYESSIEGPITNFGNSTGNMGFIKIHHGYNSGESLEFDASIQDYLDSPGGTGLINTYMVKQGFYMDADAGNGEYITWRPVVMYALPRVQLDPCMSGLFVDYIPIDITPPPEPRVYNLTDLNTDPTPINCVLHDGSKWILLLNNNDLVTSTDFLTFTTLANLSDLALAKDITLPVLSYKEKIRYMNGLYFITNTHSNYSLFITSSDLINFNFIPTPEWDPLVKQPSDIIYTTAGEWVVFSFRGGLNMASNDGINWSSSTNNLTQHFTLGCLNFITKFKDYYFACAFYNEEYFSAGREVVLGSSDGINWNSFAGLRFEAPDQIVSLSADNNFLNNYSGVVSGVTLDNGWILNGDIIHMHFGPWLGDTSLHYNPVFRSSIWVGNKWLFVGNSGECASVYLADIHDEPNVELLYTSVLQQINTKHPNIELAYANGKLLALRYGSNYTPVARIPRIYDIQTFMDDGVGMQANVDDLTLNHTYSVTFYSNTDNAGWVQIGRIEGNVTSDMSGQTVVCSGNIPGDVYMAATSLILKATIVDNGNTGLYGETTSIIKDPPPTLSNFDYGVQTAYGVDYLTVNTNVSTIVSVNANNLIINETYVVKFYWTDNNRPAFSAQLFDTVTFLADNTDARIESNLNIINIDCTVLLCKVTIELSTDPSVSATLDMEALQYSIDNGGVNPYVFYGVNVVPPGTSQPIGLPVLSNFDYGVQAAYGSDHLMIDITTNLTQSVTVNNATLDEIYIVKFYYKFNPDLYAAWTLCDTVSHTANPDDVLVHGNLSVYTGLGEYYQLFSKVTIELSTGGPVLYTLDQLQLMTDSLDNGDWIWTGVHVTG